MTHDQRGVLAHGLLVFAVTCGLALASALVAAPEPVPSEAVSVPYVLMVVLLGTALIVGALKFTKSGKLFEGLFALAMLSGSWYLLDLLLPSSLALVAAGGVVLARVRWKIVWVFNLTMAFGIAGVVASAAGSLSVSAVLTVFTLLAFYDIVAVYGTGHMVRMFRDLASRGVLFAFVLPPLSPRTLAEPLPKATGTSSTLYLGTGDVALPAMLAAAASRGGLVHGVSAALGAMAGYVLMFSLFTRQAQRRPMPAVPPIALGAAAFYLASLILLP